MLSNIVLYFLVSIQGVESNNATMLNHQIITRFGIQQGQRAIGRFAMLPNTIRTMSRNPASIERYQTDSNYELKLAMKYAIRILRAANGCPQVASILWLHGPNYTPKARDFNTPRYLRFIKEWENINGKKDFTTINNCNNIILGGSK